MLIKEESKFVIVKVKKKEKLLILIVCVLLTLIPGIINKGEGTCNIQVYI